MMKLLSNALCLIFLLGITKAQAESFIEQYATEKHANSFSKIQTEIPGEYVEFNTELVTVRKYQDSGLVSQISTDIDGPRHDSVFGVYYDQATRHIWVRSYDDSSEDRNVVFDKYQVTESAIVEVESNIVIEGGLFGIHNDIAYVQRIEDSSAYLSKTPLTGGSETENIYNLSRTLNTSTCNLSPNAEFLACNHRGRASGVFYLNQDSVSFIEFDNFVFGLVYFLDEDSVSYIASGGIFVSDLNSETVQMDTSQIFYHSAQTDPNYSSFSLSDGHIVNLNDRRDVAYRRLSIEHFDSDWQLAEISEIDAKYTYNDYRKSNNGNLMDYYRHFELEDGTWTVSGTDFEGAGFSFRFDLLPDISGVVSDDLFALHLENALYLQSIAEDSAGSPTWQTIATLPETDADIASAAKLGSSVFMVLTNGDFIASNLSGDLVGQTNLGELSNSHLQFVMGEDEKLYVFSFGNIWQCEVSGNHCEDIMPVEDGNASIAAHKNWIFLKTTVNDSSIIYRRSLDAQSSSWEMSDFQVSDDDLPAALTAMGNFLLLGDNLLDVASNGEVLGTKDFIPVNSPDEYVELNSQNFIVNGGNTLCRENQSRCYTYTEHGLLRLDVTGLPANTSADKLENIPGTRYFTTAFRYRDTTRLFRLKDDVIFPELIQTFPEQTQEYEQNQTVTIDLKDYFSNTFEFQHLPGFSDVNSVYLEDFIANPFGELEITLTNEHTYRELPISFKTYTGITQYFSFEVPELLIPVRDVNDFPVYQESVVLQGTQNQNLLFGLNLNDLFSDPERTPLLFDIDGLPEGLNLSEDGRIIGVFAETGLQTFYVTVSDQGQPPLSVTIQISLYVSDFSGQNYVAGDFDGDRAADLAIREGQQHTLYVKNSSLTNFKSADSDGVQRIRFGLNPQDIPLLGDFDGDGLTDTAVRRNSNQYWYILNSSGVDPLTGNEDGITRRRFGMQEEDIPVPADYDGDGKTDLAVRRPSTRQWLILNSSGIDPLTNHEDGISRITFGLQEEDIPVPADYDGDGKADLAVRRPSNQFWYIRNSSNVDPLTNHVDGITRIRFGLQAEDIPVPADYDGDGKADLAVRRPSNQFWYIRNSTNTDPLTHNADGISRKRFGLNETDIPISADYDGDGKVDLAVRRPGNGLHYILNSTGNDHLTDYNDGISRLQLGTSEHFVPVAAPVRIKLELLGY